MEFLRGRLIDHLHLRVADLAASRRFYATVLEALGRGLADEDETHFTTDELWVDGAGDDPVSHVHFAFQAEDKAAVARFRAAGLRAGGRDNGGPGERPYHPGYHAAFLLDPDGNNVEAVWHGPSRRNVEAVVVTPEAPQ